MAANKQDGIDMAPEVNDTGMTQTLRVLTEQTTSRSTTTDYGGQKRALIICPDKSSEKWGPRWLRQAGFECQVTDDPKAALESYGNSSPDVVVVDAATTTAGGEPMYRCIQQSDNWESAVFVLCSTAQQIADAIDADVIDVSRKPFDWQLLARRARMVVLQKRRFEELEETRQSLKSALDVANRARKELRRSETFESVTGLPNRNVFVGLVGKGIRASQRDRNLLGVFAVEFNRFQLVIEALGHEQANLVLAEISRRLTACVSKAIDANPALRGFKTAAVGKISTGRFGIMFTCSSQRIEDHALRQEIAKAMAEPAVVAGQTVYLATSIGAALSPDDSTDPNNLLIRAESAMRDARNLGVDFRYFCEEMDAAANRRLQVEQMLHRALESSELQVAYQPINDVVTDTIVAAEALLRWPQPDGSYIAPDEFVPIAEDVGMMIRIGEFVVDSACRQLRAWRDAGFDSLRVAINVARSQLMDPEFPDIVLRSLRKHDVEARYIDFELSERGVISGNADVMEQIHKLKRTGVTISLDDFGMGDSSIAYLKDMPVDALKIDRSYIATLPSDGRESRMVAAMIALARQLELTVIAEGVETRPQLNILLSLGCDQYQGFLRSPAVSPEELLALARQATV
jgi:diguanylate cyclase (GGDEF)-like protein